MKPRRALFGLAAMTFSAAAQAIVNIEALRTGLDREGWAGRMSLSATGASGNTDTRDWGVGAYIQNRRGPIRDFVIASYDYGESNDVPSIHRAMVHGRHVRWFRPGTAWEAFLQWQQDEFRRLSNRELAGAGLRWDWGAGSDATFFLGLGAFYEHEALDAAAGGAEAKSTDTVRGNLYVTVEHAFSKTARLVSTTYFQPALGDFDDRRASEQATLSVDINESVALSISVDVSYNGRPPADVESTDVSYTSGLDIAF